MQISYIEKKGKSKVQITLQNSECFIMNEKVILTKQGYADLETKLEELKFVKRPEIVERIKEARAQGDLSENAEYEAARNEQSLIEGQIAEIEAKLKNATIIEDGARSEDGVVTGSKVTVNYPELNRTDKYVIVGTTESGTVTVSTTEFQTSLP